MTINDIKNSDGASCIFCKIIAKEIPSHIVYDDSNFLCFLDNNPVVKGHSLLIPKEHHVWMHETPDELISETFITAKKIMNIMRKGIPCDYVQMVVVGKDVPHFHIHLMPRLLNDNLPQLINIKYESEEEEKYYASKIKNAI
ncbi:MAG: HIT domain-containing protein [Candidatus Nomurabacteria bacterium]|nr:HIT domain-containing protein [Candidatus Nomurabacteria bacterium]